MGWFSNNSDAEKLTAQANEETTRGRAAAKEAAACRKRLASGSSDPAADRYLLREHEADRRGAEASAKTLTRFAKQSRRRWF